MPTPELLGLASPALVDRVQLATSQALRTWSLRWGVEAGAAAAPLAEGGVPAAQRDGTHIWREDGEGGGAWLVQPNAMEEALQAVLYGPRQGAVQRDSLAARSAQHLAGDLRKLLGQAWQVREWAAAAQPPAPASRWRAPVHVEVTVAGVRLHAVVPALRLRTERPRGPQALLAGAQVLAAFGSLAAAVTAVIGTAEISIGDTAGLQCGDVLVLDTSVREPLRLAIDGGPAVLRAALGRRGELRAARLLPSEPGAIPVSQDLSSRPGATPQDVELSPLEATAAGTAALLPPHLAPFGGIKATVQVIAGRASASVGELLSLKEGALLTLDRAVDAPFDVVLDGAVLARGQLVAVGEQFGLRITELCIPSK